MLSPIKERQLTLFKAFMESDDEAVYLDDESPKRPNDQRCKELIKAQCGVDTVVGFQTLSQEERNSIIRMLKINGASIRQIARLTGMPFGVVRAR